MNPRWQPALYGGLVVGVLSALPVVSAGNLCCCLWIIAGGGVAAWTLQQEQTTPISEADGALAGFQAGTVGALVYVFLSIPITFLMAPMQRAALERLAQEAESMPPEFREYLSNYVGGMLGVVLGFIFMLLMGAIFSTLGGLLGAVIFKRQAAAQAPTDEA